jgi:hypothetical protein
VTRHIIKIAEAQLLTNCGKGDDRGGHNAHFRFVRDYW